MKNKQTLYAGGAFVLLALLYFFTSTGAVDTKSIDAEQFSIDKSQVHSMSLRGGETQLDFIRNDSGWMLDSYPVDTARTNRFLDEITTLAIDRLITKNTEKHEKYEVSDQASGFILNSESGKELLNILVGKQGANFQETFVRESGEDEVYAVKASLGQYKTKSPSDFWDRTMTSFDANQINSVEFQGEFNYTLRRNGPVWTFNDEQVDFEKVSNMLRPLENLTASNFTEEITEANPFYQSIRIGFENDDPINLEFYLKSETGALLLVSVSNLPKLFEYSKSGLNRFKKTGADLAADPPPSE